MGRYILFIVAIGFCFAGIKLLMTKTGDHDNDFIFKIIGIIVFFPSLLLLLSALGIIG